MLMTGMPDKKAREVPVLEDDVEITRLRAVPDRREWITFQADDRPWSVECTWIRTYERGDVVARPAAEPSGPAPLRAQYWGQQVRRAELDGRVLQIDRASLWRGTHRYSHAGRWLAETDATGFFKVRATLTADPSVPRHEALFLLCLDLYTCRRNTTAAGALGFHPVPTESYV